MYSLILSDHIVSAIDVLATQQGLSRSALVNHILAEYANLSTPETKTQQIIAAIEQQLNGQLRSMVSAGGILTLRTALSYKYNPQLNYVLELEPEHSSELGQLRVGIRSQNQALLIYIQLFFQLWNKLEQKYLNFPPESKHPQLQSQRFVRTLRRPAGLHGGSQAGQAVTAYILLMDGCLKAYFRNLENAEQAMKATEQYFIQHLPELGLAAEL